MSDKSIQRKAPVERSSACTVRVRVRARNQLTLPQAMLDALGIEAGEELEVSRDGRGLRLEPVSTGAPAQRPESLRAFLLEVSREARQDPEKLGTGPGGRGWTRDELYE